MKSFYKYTLIVILLSFYSISFSQNSSELGFMFGGTYYQGDLNTSKLFQSPFFAGGVLYRHNFSTRYALRASVIVGKLISSDANSNFVYQQIRNYSFRSTIYDITPQIEFNFFDYLPNDPNFRSTPYVSLGATFVFAAGTPRPYQFAIPFGLGVKYSLSPKISTGIEWSYRKTFTDYIDSTVGLADNEYSKQLGYNHDNDWYSYAGIFIAFRFSTKKAGKCPAYSSN